jgi:hypothetical protein
LTESAQPLPPSARHAGASLAARNGASIFAHPAVKLALPPPLLSTGGPPLAAAPTVPVEHRLLLRLPGCPEEGGVAPEEAAVRGPPASALPRREPGNRPKPVLAEHSLSRALPAHIAAGSNSGIALRQLMGNP